MPRGRAATPGTPPHPSIHRLPRAELLKRGFAMDALTCPWCGGPRKPIARVPFAGCHWQPAIRGADAPRTGAYLTDGLIVRKILSHLRLPTEPLPLAPDRAPPEPAFAW